MGRHEGAELLTAQNTAVLNVTLRSAPWRAPQGDVLVHSGWENSVNMLSVLANTSTDNSQEYTLLRDFAGPVGDTPKVTLRKSCLAPADGDSGSFCPRFVDLQVCKLCLSECSQQDVPCVRILHAPNAQVRY